MEVKGACARCTHPVYHTPLVCKHCKQGFCLYCYRDVSLPLRGSEYLGGNACVQCHDGVDHEHAMGMQQDYVEDAWVWAENHGRQVAKQRRLQYDQLVFGVFCVVLLTCWYLL
jgi:hypothetical protein